MYCKVTGTFGRQAWPLGTVEAEYPKSTDAYKWFARFFLEGKVFKKLAQYNEYLLQRPTVITKPWARLQPRIVRILNKMIANDCRSRRRLEEIWKEDPKCEYN